MHVPQRLHPHDHHDCDPNAKRPYSVQWRSPRPLSTKHNSGGARHPRVCPATRVMHRAVVRAGHRPVGALGGDTHRSAAPCQSGLPALHHDPLPQRDGPSATTIPFLCQHNPQHANHRPPLTRKRHIPPHSAQPRHANYWAPRTRKRHQREHRPQQPTERSDPTQHAKGRTGDCPGPRKETTTRRNVARGGGVSIINRGAPPPPLRILGAPTYQFCPSLCHLSDFGVETKRQPTFLRSETTVAAWNSPPPGLSGVLGTPPCLSPPLPGALQWNASG